MYQIQYSQRSLDNFLSAVIEGWKYVDYPISSKPVVYYLVQSLLIQMCGFIEQKYDSILWEIGHISPSIRYGLLKDYSIGSIKLGTMNNFVKNILKVENSSYLTMDNYFIQQYPIISQKIKERFESHPIYNEISYLWTTHKHTIIENNIFLIIKAGVEKRNSLAHFKDFYNISNTLSLFDNNIPDFNYIDVFCILITIDMWLTDSYKNFIQSQL